MRIAIIGATGYIGHNLIDRLLRETEHEVIALSRSAEAIQREHERLRKRNVDVFDQPNLTKALAGADVAYYLVHMMGQGKRDFVTAELGAAHSFATAAQRAGVKRVIYLGGLGNDRDELSKHLASRHETGEVLRSMHPQVIEFRASMIIGEGSISYDIITNLVHKLPVLTLPKWSRTETQPIGLDDMISYLVAAAELELHDHEIVEVGGPEVLSYEAIMKGYCEFKGKKRLIIHFPVIPVSIASWWLNLFTPRNHAKVGRAMVESLGNPMVVTNDRAKELFPGISPKPIEEVYI